MTESRSLTPLRNEDYAAIEAAVMETARGRWFLSEYTRRNRSADTEMLLEAIQKLEGNLERKREVPDIDAIKLDIADMADAIARTKQEIAQIAAEGESGGRIFAASNELDSIVEHTETATQEILTTAEAVQELAFEMREAGVDGAFCDRLEEFATNTYMACSFQDVTGQRTQKVVHVLRYLETRVNEMIRIWHGPGGEAEAVVPDPVRPDDPRPDAHLLHGPQVNGEGSDQAEIDHLMAQDPADALSATAAPTADAGAGAGEAEISEPGTVGGTDDGAEAEADIFQMSGPGDSAAGASGFSAVSAEEFEGADVFEVAATRSGRSVGDGGATKEDPSLDPVAEMTAGERLALFH